MFCKAEGSSERLSTGGQSQSRLLPGGERHRALRHLQLLGMLLLTLLQGVLLFLLLLLQGFLRDKSQDWLSTPETVTPSDTRVGPRQGAPGTQERHSCRERWVPYGRYTEVSRLELCCSHPRLTFAFMFYVISLPVWFSG